MIHPPRRAPWTALALLAAVAIVPADALSAAEAPHKPPLARREVVVDSAFGLRMEDPYRWMERPDNAEFRVWLLAQGKYARSRLDAIPGRSAMAKRLRELSFESSGLSSVQRSGSRLFYLRADKGSSLAKLVVRAGDGTEIAAVVLMQRILALLPDTAG